MSDPWYDGNLYGWIPGATLGVLVGVWGALVGMLAPRGRARGLVFGFTGLLLLSSAALLALGVAALLCGQPYGIWYGLGLAGLIGLVVIGANTFLVFWAYRLAEARKMEARDLTDVQTSRAGPPSIPAD